MNAPSIVLLFVFFAMVSAEDWQSSFRRNCDFCIVAYNVSYGQLDTWKIGPSSPDLSTVSQNLKCAMKCTLERSGLIVRGKGFDFDRLVQIRLAEGAQEDIEKCRLLSIGSDSCDEIFTLWDCLVTVFQKTDNVNTVKV